MKTKYSFFYVFFFLFLSINLFSEQLWKKLENLKFPCTIYDLATTENGIIYVGTEFSNIYKSTDDGKTWNQIKIDYVFTRFNVKKESCKFKSDNDGNLYFERNNSLFKIDANSFKAKTILHSENSDDYGNSSISISSDGKTIVYFNGAEIWLSKDKGLTWKDINFGLYKNLLFKLKSVTYDDNYGVIKNYFYGSLGNISSLIYNTSIEGKIWTEMTLIPGSTLYSKEITVIDTSTWIINYNSSWRSNSVFNPITKVFNEIPAKYSEIRKFHDILYFTTDSSIFFTEDFGESWIFNNRKIFPEFKDTWINAFSISKNGDIIVGSNNGELKKSKDKGKSWDIIDFNSSESEKLNYSKFTDKGIYCFEWKNYVINSTDNGNSWSKIHLNNDQNTTNRFDVNQKGEIVCNDGNIIKYSSNNGKDWVNLDTSVSKISNMIINILDNGWILAQPSYGTSYIYKNIFDKPQINNYLGGKNFKILKDGRIISAIYGISITNKECTERKVIFRTIFDVNCFTINKNENIFVGTSNGLYKAESADSEFNLIAFQNSIINNLHVDDNNYIYICFEGFLYVSKDDGNTWSNIGEDKNYIFNFLAYGNSKLLIRNYDDIYFADIKGKNILSIKAITNNNELYLKDTLFIDYEVKDEYGKLVTNSGIVVYNSLLDKIDTIFTDTKGKANIFIHINEKYKNLSKYFKIYSYAFKENHIRSQITEQNFINIGYERSFFVLNSEYIMYKPNKNFQEVFSIGSIVDGKYQKGLGTLIIRNELLNLIDTIPNIIGNYIYNFKIPINTTPGIYNISCYAKSIDGLTSQLSILHLIVIENIKEYNGGNVAEFIYEELQITPNPAQNYILIKNKSNKDNFIFENIEIYDASGSLIRSSLLNNYSEQNELIFDISSLNSGIYFVKVDNVFGKFIKD